jgi:hypothetical protein
MTMDDEVCATRVASPQAAYPWLAAQATGDDSFAEILAVLALAFAIGVGLVIALMPVTVRATSVDLVLPVTATAASTPAR